MSKQTGICTILYAFELNRALDARFRFSFFSPTCLQAPLVNTLQLLCCRAKAKKVTKKQTPKNWYRRYGCRSV